MRVRVTPGGSVQGTTSVPGDKSVAHRWLILAATARGASTLRGVPPSLDVRSTASCLAALLPKTRPTLDVWARQDAPRVEPGGSTWNLPRGNTPVSVLEVQGEGRGSLVAPDGPLDCGNSGTSMRLLAGVLASTPVGAVLIGDRSLSRRPMERVAEPLRRMGATVETTEGHAPLTVRGGDLVGIRFEPEVPSAQLKSAVLLAGLDAEGPTTVTEPARTRDHMERALLALGAPVVMDGNRVSVSRFQQDGFSARVPGDPSSAAFLVVAAALTGSSITLAQVGLNPTRLHYLEVLARMGVRTDVEILGEELGEPVGILRVGAGASLRCTTIEADELPLVIDEVPVLAALAAHAPGETWFVGAGELRLKESDRLAALVTGLRGLGGNAGTEGDDLVVPGLGLTGGAADSGGDHRMAMSFAVASLAADAPCLIGGMEAAEVSFPSFPRVLGDLGATLEVVG
jgi:3-phosphoshikimate 1-carboxyvinyltransferase